VACEILKREIDKLVEGDPDIVHKEYLEFALHVDSANLKAKVEEKVNALKGQVDAVFLGYAVCQSLRDITKRLEVPAVMLESDDCIGVFLSPEGYAHEKRICTGTWFSSPGWAELGWDGVVKELHLDSMKDQGYDAEYFMKLIFQGYSRCLFIDTGVSEMVKYEALAADLAQRLNLRYERTSSASDMLEVGIRKTKALANGRSSHGQDS
jgi:hypothetical protein